MKTIFLMLSLIVAMPAWLPHYVSEAHAAVACDCPPDCHCHQPGGTCPGATCSEDCACDLEWGPAIPSVKIDGKKYFTGYKRHPRQYARAQYRSVKPFEQGADGPIPLEYDMRKLVKLTVKQQRCGDCWAQGGRSAMQGVIGLFDGKFIEPSVQAVIDCSGYGSCGGGQLSMGFYVDPKGVVYESSYGYAGRTQRCQTSSLVLNEKMKSSFYLRAASGGGLPSVQETQRSIMRYAFHEVCGASSALGSGGWYESIRYGREDHCYALVGWLDGATHGKKPGVYWIIMNSWGEGWGEKGYGYYLASTDGVKMMGNIINEIQGVDYKDLCPVSADGGPDQNILNAPGHPSSTQIGMPVKKDMVCAWSPNANLSDATACQPMASPKKTTTYTVTVTNSTCGSSASAQVTVHVFNKLKTGKFAEAVGK